MMRAVGFTATMSLVFEYPAMVLLPVFSYWTIGPPDTGRLCFKPSSRSHSVIGVSFFYTLLNCLMTIICSSLSIYFTIFKKSRLEVQDYYIPYIICSATFLFVGFLCIVILRCCKNKQCCDVPLTNKVDFDVNEQEEEGEDQIEEKDGLEMTKVVSS